MKKRLLTVLVLLGIILPYGQSIVYAVAQQEPLAENQLKLQTDTTEKQTVLDEDYAKVTASYVETETNYQWIIEFEKKASQNESRIRIAIDTTANGFGTVSDIRGQGLSSADADSDELKAMKVENDEKDLDWYYGEVYSNSAEKGTLSFTSEKISDDSGELPLVVAVDQQTSETSDTEQPTDATEEQTVETVEQTTETDGTSEQTSESTEQTTETTEESTEESIAANGSGTRFYRSVAQPFANGVGLKPFSPNDPFGYSADLSIQQRYLNHATNDFSMDKEFFESYQYDADSGQGDLINQKTSQPYTDEESLKNGQLIGGANWRNYDYINSEGNDIIAPTTNVWGETPNFTNSYLNYNGAYLKKWVEPVVADENKYNGTTTYNVYLDVIGETIQNKKALDIVFVLDKSSSMQEAVNSNTNTSKDSTMTKALKSVVTKLFEEPDLDLRIGMVDFGTTATYKGKGDDKKLVDRNVFSNTFSLSGELNRVLNNNKPLNTRAPDDSGTPLSYGIKKGYEALYADNGLNRDPEKILIVVDDGTPTYSYSGFRYTDEKKIPTTDTDWSFKHEKVSKYWAEDKWTEDKGYFIRNYEDASYDDYYSNFSNNEYYPTHFTINSDNPNESRPPGERYRFGEALSTSVHKDLDWFGSGNTTTSQEYNHDNAIHTIAYHHWLREKYANPKPRVFCIGLGLSEITSEMKDKEKKRAVADALGRNVLKNIADLKNNTSDPNESYYYDADSEDKLVAALTEISGELTKTIQNATLTDVLGDSVSVVTEGKPKVDFYHLKKNGAVYEAPGNWGGTFPEIKEDLTDNTFKFSNITLGAGEMMRISYQVELKDEAQDGRFKTVNDQVYLVNGSNNPDTDRMYFPSPSIRYLKKQMTDDLDFLIKKVDENGEPLNGVGFTLTDKDGKVFKAISGIDGYEDDDITPIPNNNGSGIFYDESRNRLDLAVGTYKVKETDPLPAYVGLEDEFVFTVNNKGEFEYDTENLRFSLEKKILSLTVKNEVKPLALEFTKIDSHSNKPVKGAEFTIQKWDADKQGWEEPEEIIGDSSFRYDQLEIGRYKIDEVSPPAGYRASLGYIVLDVFADEGSMKAKLTYFNDQDKEIEGKEQPDVETQDKEQPDVETQDNDTVLISFNVENDPVVPLPSTGGQGRMIYYAIAALLVSAMLVLGFYYYRRTQRRGE